MQNIFKQILVVPASCGRGRGARGAGGLNICSGSASATPLLP